jgi:hypothetical protein
MTITFISFANEKFSKALERIKIESNAFPIDTRIMYTEKDLENFSKFWEQHKNFILSNKRGYGYWIWKSYITLHTLSQLNDNDILWYTDAGCTLNKEGIPRFMEYIDIVKNNKSGILSFEMAYKQKTWTKMDLLSLFDKDQYDLGQLVGGIFFIRKCENTLKLVSEWYKICCNYHLINDEPSILKNDSSFKEHRHDQSVFSLLRYKYGTDIIGINLKYGPEGETTYSCYNTSNNPIHANRKRN